MDGFSLFVGLDVGLTLGVLLGIPIGVWGGALRMIRLGWKPPKKNPGNSPASSE